MAGISSETRGYELWYIEAALRKDLSLELSTPPLHEKEPLPGG